MSCAQPGHSAAASYCPQSVQYTWTQVKSLPRSSNSRLISRPYWSHPTKKKAGVHAWPPLSTAQSASAVFDSVQSTDACAIPSHSFVAFVSLSCASSDLCSGRDSLTPVTHALPPGNQHLPSAVVRCITRLLSDWSASLEPESVMWRGQHCIVTFAFAEFSLWYRHTE